MPHCRERARTARWPIRAAPLRSGDVALAAHSCVLPSGSVTTDATVRTAQTGSANHSGTTPALFKLQSGDGAAVSAGQIIWTKSGTGANQLRQIIATAGYGTDVVAVSRDWGTVPDATTTYKILQGMLFEISPNPVTAVVRMFSTSAADVPAGLQRTYYEKVFVVNNNTATALTGAQIEVASDTPSPAFGRAVRPGTDDGAERHRHRRQPADRPFLGRRLFHDAARLCQRTEPRQPAARGSAECGRRARCVAAPDPAGRRYGLQGLGRSANAGHNDINHRAHRDWEHCGGRILGSLFIRIRPMGMTGLLWTKSGKSLNAVAL